MPDLGVCEGFDAEHDGERETGKTIACVDPADRVAAGVKLCDSHAYFDALARLKPCPNCGGSCASGLHRGMIVGHGLVKTCSATAMQRQLQRMSQMAVAVDWKASMDLRSGEVEVSHELREIDPDGDEARALFSTGAVGEDQGDDEDDDDSCNHETPKGEFILSATEDGHLHIREVREEFGDDDDDDGWRYGDECLTDSERNPTINDRGRLD